jgi:hypothetical protein
VADADPVEESAETQETQDARLVKLEAEQAEQGGKLDQILGLLKGGEGKAHDAAQEHTEEHLDRSSTIADQVRQAVEQVGAEKAAKEAEEAHKADHAALREQREKPPRESQSGFRGKLQRAMFGSEPG